MTLIPTSQSDAAISVEVGKVPSLNSFYASKHWILRKKAKDKFKEEILEQLNQYDKVAFKCISVKALVNYRYDLDNSIMCIKFALDAFKEWGGIPDDTKAYVCKVTIEDDSTLPKDTSKVFFIPRLEC